MAEVQCFITTEHQRSSASLAQVALDACFGTSSTRHARVGISNLYLPHPRLCKYAPSSRVAFAFPKIFTSTFHSLARFCFICIVQAVLHAKYFPALLLCWSLTARSLVDWIEIVLFPSIAEGSHNTDRQIGRAHV